MSQAQSEWNNANLMPHGKERDEAIQQWCNDWLETLFQTIEDKDEAIYELESQINDDRTPSDIHDDLINLCDRMNIEILNIIHTKRKKLLQIENELRSIASELI